MNKLSHFLNTHSFKFLLLWVLILSILYSTLSVVRHTHYQSGAFDLGIFDQATWQYSRFLSPYNTVKERFILGDHLTLTLPLLAPLYWVWNNVKILLIFQSVWIACSAIAIYLIARRKKFTGIQSLILSIIYSLFYGIQFGAFFDFHTVILGVGLLAWTIYFFESGNKKLFWIFLLLTILTQENMGIALAGIGCLYLFEEDKRKAALFFIVGGIGVSLLLVKVTAGLSPIGYEYQPKIDLNPIHLFQKLFDHPDKRLVWLYSFGWFSFLPLFSPGAVLAVALDIAQYFLPQKQYAHMISPFLHHRAILAVFLIVGTFQVLEFLRKKKINITLIVFLMLISSLIQQYVLHYPLNKLIKKSYFQTYSYMNDNDKLLKDVPKDASIAAQDNLVPHLSHRKEIYIAWPRQKDLKEKPCGQKTCWILEFSGKPKYLVVNISQDQWITQLLETPTNFKSAVENLEKLGKIKKVKKIDSAILYEIH